MMRRALTAIALASTLAPLVCSAADVAQASGGLLPHGGSYRMLRDATVSSAAVDLWFRAPSDGYEKSQLGVARLAATSAASAPLESGKTLVALVRDLGGELSVNVFPDIVGVSIRVPASAARRVLAAATSAYFSPAIDDGAFKAAQRDGAVVAAEHRFTPDDLVHDALFAQLFSSGPQHVAPEPPDVAAIASISLDDVRAFARRAFRASNAVVSLTGNVDPSMIDAVTAGAPGKPDAPIDSPLSSAPQAVSTVAADVDGNGVAWAGPSIDDERAATAMDFIADYLFGEPGGTLTRAYASSNKDYAEGQFITLHQNGVMLVTFGGDADVQKHVLDAVSAMRAPLDATSFAAAKQAFLYHIASGAQTPNEQADSLGWYAVEGQPAYAPSDIDGTYWDLAQHLDADFVASVAGRYLSQPTIVHVHAATGKESTS